MIERNDDIANDPPADGRPGGSWEGAAGGSTSLAPVPRRAESEAAVDLSVVIPVYNEAHRIAGTVAAVHAWLASRRKNRDGSAEPSAAEINAAEIIVVSDGSSDDPAAVLELGERDGVTTRCLELEKNCGKGAAVRRGVLEARGALVLFSDADLATPIEESARLERAIEAGVDIAIASRRVPDSDVQVEQSLSRRLTGGLFPRVVRLLTGLPYADTQCGFKMFRRETISVLFSELREERFAFDVELLCAAREQGFRVAEVGVVWRDSGETTVNLLRDPLRMGTTLLRLADPERFPRVFARQLGLAALLTLALFAFARGSFSGSLGESLSAFPAGEGAAVESAEGMIEEGDWLLPTRWVAGERTVELGRAPLGEWAIAASRSLFGSHDFSRRLPSYLSGLLLLALVFRAARCFGQRDLAALATLVLGSSLLFLALWGTEITDLTATLSLAGVWLSALIARSPGSSQPLLWTCVSSALLGLACLAVGPLALPLALIPQLLLRRDDRTNSGSASAADPEAPVGARRLRWGLVGLAFSLAIALSWYAMVEARFPGAWREFFSSEGGVSRSTVWLTWAAGLLPWPILLLLSGRRGVRGLAEASGDSRIRALLAAALLPPIAATIIRPADPTWILPALPPAAIVLALGIRSGLTGAVEFRLRIALFTAAPVIGVFLVLAVAVTRPSLFDPWLGLVSAGAAMAVLAVVATGTARRVA